MFEEALEIVIVGTTTAVPRVSPQRLGRALVRHDVGIQRRPALSYSPYLKPVMPAGVRCVVVGSELEKIDRRGEQFPVRFSARQRTDPAAGTLKRAF